MRDRNILRKLLCVTCILSLLCSCASKTNQERVSEEELAQLREQYGYHDSASSMAYSYISDEEAYPTFEALMGINNPYATTPDFHAVVVVELIEDWYFVGTYVPPTDDEELNEVILDRTPSAANITWPVHDAVIERVLWGGEDLAEGDVIALCFGSSGYVGGMELEECYLAGGRYVCFVIDRRDNGFGKNNLFAASKTYTYYLSNHDVLISMTSVPGADECSGMYVDAFEEKLHATIPDAEIDDPTPPLETE